MNAIHRTAAMVAQNAVASAVRHGSLLRLSKVYVKCTDCRKRACVYDHRDYNLLTKVDPVCKGCNRRRGKAKFIAPVGFVAKKYAGDDDRWVVMRISIPLYKAMKQHSKEQGRTVARQAAEYIKRCLNGQA